MLCGAAGIVLNVLLFIFKILAGILSRSMAVTADAFNNLSDASASIITVIGFKLSLKRPDAEHPFGHGRSEYIAGLIISLLIIVTGIELARSSIMELLAPSPVERSAVLFVVLGVSVLVKTYMLAYNYIIARRVRSTALAAAARDSAGDIATTLIVLAAMIAVPYTSFPVDGVAGGVVSVFILYSGVQSAVKTINPLLGQPPDSALVQAIAATVCAHASVVGVHDIIVHDYGPGRTMISLHVELPSSDSFTHAHEVVDQLEHELSKRFHCATLIHMDPTDVDDPDVASLRTLVAQEAATIHKGISIHDFRIVRTARRVKLIFDAVNPYSSILDDESLRKTLAARVQALRPECRCVITVDRPFVSDEG